jgi:dihydropteroate synthase
MGILNLTEDSFFAGSRMLRADGTLDERLFSGRVAAMLSEGAGILDLGAVSTRPGAAEVSFEEEWRRLEPALRLLRRDFPAARFSVDTTRSGIVERVYDLAGPFIVNDISA